MPKRPQIRKSAIIPLIFTVVFSVDQITKAYAGAFIPAYDSRTIIPGLLNIVNIRNPGAAFGLLNDGGAFSTYLLLAISCIAIVVIAFLLYRAVEGWTVVTLSLIGGGALGNMADRLFFGEVVDFIDLHAFGYHWPAFNVADSAISIGVVLYIYFSYFRQDDARSSS